jgi:hypothetical protein
MDVKQEMIEAFQAMSEANQHNNDNKGNVKLSLCLTN